MASYAGNYPPRRPEEALRTLSPEEAAAYWSPEAAAERERNVPEPGE